MAVPSASGKVGGGIWKELSLLDGEVVTKEGHAYHRAGALHLVWGRLFLTNKRLLYCPWKLAGPWRSERLAYALEEIEALGRAKRPWYWVMLLWGMAPDTLFIEVGRKRHWFSLGWGWSKSWLTELAERTGLTPSDES
jgi:hypothetical protein